jgi:hypothetical protein
MNGRMIALSQRIVDDHKDQDGAETSPAKFFSAVTCYQRAQPVGHMERFLLLLAQH